MSNPPFRHSLAGEREQEAMHEKLQGFLTTGTNVLTKSLFGRQRAETVTAVTTFNGIQELETDFLSFRIGIPNIHTASVPGVKVSVGVVASVPAADYQVWNTPENNEWIDATFNGSATWELPVRLGEERCSWALSDEIQLPSIPRTDILNGRTLVIYRVEYPANSVVTMPANNMYYWRGSQAPRVLRTANQAVAGVTNKASFTSIAAYAASKGGDDYGVVPLIQYRTLARGHQMMISGDSIQEGIGGNVRCYGAHQRAAYELSTPDAPVEYFNAGLHAQVPDIYSRFLIDHIEMVRPTILTYAPWSGNDVATGGIQPAAVRRYKAGLGRVSAFLQAKGLRPIVLIPEATPTDTSARNVGAGDQLRRDYNNVFLARASIGYVIRNWAATMTGSRDANGQDQANPTRINASDRVHPNDLGFDDLKELVKPFVRRALELLK